MALTKLLDMVLFWTVASAVVLESFSPYQYVTTVATNATFNDTECFCDCDESETIKRAPSTQEEAAKAATKLAAELFVDKSNLSATTRKKTSAPDHRPSARGLGAVGIIVIVTVIVSIIALDLTILIRDVKATARRLLGYGVTGRRGAEGGAGAAARAEWNVRGAEVSHIYTPFQETPAQPSADSTRENGEDACYAGDVDVRAVSDTLPEPLPVVTSGMNDIRSRRELLLMRSAPH